MNRQCFKRGVFCLVNWQLLVCKHQCVTTTNSTGHVKTRVFLQGRKRLCWTDMQTSVLSEGQVAEDQRVFGQMRLCLCHCCYCSPAGRWQMKVPVLSEQLLICNCICLHPNINFPACYFKNQETRAYGCHWVESSKDGLLFAFLW